MSGYKPSAGDVVVIEASENGQQWFAKVDHITKGNRVVAWWHQRTRKGGDSKPRALIPGKETLVRKAAPFEAAAFERGEL